MGKSCSIGGSDERLIHRLANFFAILKDDALSGALALVRGLLASLIELSDELTARLHALCWSLEHEILMRGSFLERSSHGRGRAAQHGHLSLGSDELLDWGLTRGDGVAVVIVHSVYLRAAGTTIKAEHTILAAVESATAR